jgi:hypothetical protein
MTVFLLLFAFALISSMNAIKLSPALQNIFHPLAPQRHAKQEALKSRLDIILL